MRIYISSQAVDQRPAKDLILRLREKGASNDEITLARDTINQIMLEQATRAEAIRANMRRRGIEGASTDHARIVAGEAIAHAARMGHFEFGDERARALNRMQLVVNELGRNLPERMSAKGETLPARTSVPGEQIRAQIVLNELQKRL